MTVFFSTVCNYPSLQTTTTNKLTWLFNPKFIKMHKLVLSEEGSWPPCTMWDGFPYAACHPRSHQDTHTPWPSLVLLWLTLVFLKGQSQILIFGPDYSLNSQWWQEKWEDTGTIFSNVDKSNLYSSVILSWALRFSRSTRYKAKPL